MMIINGLDFTQFNADLTEIINNRAFVKTIHKNDNIAVNCNDEAYYWMGKTALDSICTVVDTLQSPPHIKDNITRQYLSDNKRKLR